jgi:hypothetical protein
MLTRSRPPVDATAGPGEWGRGRLIAALMLLLLIVLSLVAGVVLWVWLRFHPAATDATTGPASSSVSGSNDGGAGTTAGTAVLGGTSEQVQARRDALAAAPMAKSDLSKAQPSTLSTRDPGAIVLPTSTSTGPVGIPSGFPHTTEGALAQLAAIDADVLNAAGVDHARQVITGWAAPGGPTAQSWTGVQAIAGFLSAARLSPAGGSGLAIRATPLMGMVKATDGPDWAVVCVDLEVDATLKASGQVAVADCQRMAWNGSRWQIGPGAEPAPGPSIWPGTDAAIDAGWKTLRHG